MADKNAKREDDGGTKNSDTTDTRITIVQAENTQSTFRDIQTSSILYAQAITSPGILYHSSLHPQTDAEERYSTLPRE